MTTEFASPLAATATAGGSGTVTLNGTGGGNGGIEYAASSRWA